MNLQKGFCTLVFTESLLLVTVQPKAGSRTEYHDLPGRGRRRGPRVGLVGLGLPVRGPPLLEPPLRLLLLLLLGLSLNLDLSLRQLLLSL